MDFIKFDSDLCTLCGECIKSCPFRAMTMGKSNIEVNETCRMCGVCVKLCPQKAISFEQKAGTVDKTLWNDILIFAETLEDDIHPVVYELIGEAKKLAENVNYKIKAVLLGKIGIGKLAKNLLEYGVDEVLVYEHKELENFKADCFTDVVADCISSCKPSVVLFGATALGRGLAPRLATRFHTGLTADCTKLEMRSNTDLVQIRPAFGGNIMAQILITDSRPQFATVRYKVMDKARQVKCTSGIITQCKATDDMVKSRIKVIESKHLEEKKSIEEEDILIVVGRGVTREVDLNNASELAKLLGGQLCFTRPMVEDGFGDTAHQIGLSGRTVRPKMIMTFGVSGAIQFTACMNGADCIIAVNSDAEAQIFNIANYKVVDDAGDILANLVSGLNTSKEESINAYTI